MVHESDYTQTEYNNKGWFKSHGQNFKGSYSFHELNSVKLSFCVCK